MMISRILSSSITIFSDREPTKMYWVKKMISAISSADAMAARSSAKPI
jgi:hypothetical protein